MATSTRHQSFASHIPSARQRAITRMREEQRRQAHVAELQALDSLCNVPPTELRYLVDQCVFRVFAPDTTIISERKPGEFLYILLAGSLRLTLHDKEGHEVLLGVLSRGDCFGEGPLFGDYFRRVGIYTETQCHVLQLSLASVRELLPVMPTFQAVLQTIYRRRLVESTLARVPLFSRISPLERVLLAELLQPLEFPRGSLIVRQGECGDSLYLIEGGQVVVEADGKAIAFLDEGDFFGEIALLAKEPHTATVRALTPLSILALPAIAFDDLLKNRPDFQVQLETTVAQRRANTEQFRHDRDRVTRMTRIMEHGLLRGSHLLVRSPELCLPDCRLCEAACASRHGYARLRMEGVALGQQHVVDACRQCRVGAECVEACPEDAFEWNDKGVLLINDKCTGCGACVPACPYNAITRVPRTTKTANGPLWQLWRTIKAMKARLHSPMMMPLEPVSPTYTHRADKCDLCDGYPDLACVTACPTGALRLVPVEELLPL